MITLLQNEISASLKDHKPYQRFLEAYTRGRFPLELQGPRGSFLAFILRALRDYTAGPMVMVVPTEKEADALTRDLALFADAVPSARFPWWGTMLYKGVSAQSGVYGERVRTLHRLLQGERAFFVVPQRAFLGTVPPPAYLKERVLSFQTGREMDPAAMEEALQGFGYYKVPRVSVPGEFALRGEVLDIFPAGEEEALRVVFAYDEIEEIRFFDTVSQGSSGKVKARDVYPLREVLWDSERLEVLERRLGEEPAFAGAGAGEGALKALMEELRETGRSRGEEVLYPLAFEEGEGAGLADYLPEGCTVFYSEYERLLSAPEVIEREYGELHREARRQGMAVPRPEPFVRPFQEDADRTGRAVYLTALRQEGREMGEQTSLTCEGPRSYFGNIKYFKEQLQLAEENGYTTFVFAESAAQAQRIEYLLQDFDTRVIPQSLSAGFSLPELKLQAIQENETLGRRQRGAGSAGQAKRRTIDSFVDLTPGDLVVHVNYGIGRFKGIERIQAAGRERDYIQLEYAGEETVFIPIEQVNLVQRYIGKEGQSPRLDKLGGKSWESRKSKVRKAVEDLADRLVKLYARRRKARGYAFPADTDWQVEFEASFPYQETEDQLTAISEVKADMESQRPMDRLICGDVGYGKTEVAMRAAFKAVMGGRQVAFLAPTTILAEQHFESFQERFERFPVKIRMMSRFVAPSDQKGVISDMETGEADILIGTHRILSKDIRFKNLGLLIVDEEQRFGVKDKERLKELKTAVDSLTLSATPIPRTLHMSLVKIRDMSVLQTPPSNRHPIETFVQEFDEELAARAIRREMERGGQVFYLHNRVESLENVQLFIQELVPEAMVEMAHGKMSSRELETIMHRFIHGGAHVLVSTTIIENGIDIPNVNTIIIDRADMYGISQLYQLRGRVGRSGRLAYAYLFYPQNRALTDLAMKRLQIISDFTDLGSGFKIAMKDMEVRGAGNLLGPQQSGQILAVGFDMYLRLLEEAVEERVEEKHDQVPEVYMELEYTGFIPDSYIPDSSEKMEEYKKITSIDSDEELERLYSELHDRFGPLPDEVQSLLALAEIRILSRKLSIVSLKERKGMVQVEFGRVKDIDVEKVLRLIQESGGRAQLDPSQPQMLLLKTGSIGLQEKSEFLRGQLSRLQ